jgi:hypothetical protein
MAHAWQRGLTSAGDPQPPAKGSRVRLVIRADAVSDGVSESGIRADKVATMLAVYMMSRPSLSAMRSTLTGTVCRRMIASSSSLLPYAYAMASQRASRGSRICIWCCGIHFTCSIFRLLR